MQRSRRAFVAGTGLVAAAGVAGCIGGLGDDDGSHEPLEVTEFDLVDREADAVVADVHDDHWHGSLPAVPVDGQVSFGAEVEDADGERVELGSDATYELRAEVPDDAPEGILEIDNHGDHVDLHGVAEGVTGVTFMIWHDDHAEFTTPEIDIQVVDE